MAPVSTLTGKRTKGWNRPEPPRGPSPEMKVVLDQLAIQRRSMMDSENAREADRLKDVLVQTRTEHTAAVRQKDDELARIASKVSELEAQLANVGSAAAGFEKARESLEGRIRSLTEQLDDADQQRIAALGEQEARLRKELAVKPRKGKKGAAQPTIVQQVERPPSQVKAEPMRDAAGLLRRIALKADGWKDIVIDVQRGGDDSIVGVLIT